METCLRVKACSLKLASNKSHELGVTLLLLLQDTRDCLTYGIYGTPRDIKEDKQARTWPHL